MSGIDGLVAGVAAPRASTRPLSNLDSELRFLARAVEAVTSVPVDELEADRAARVHDELRALSDRLRAYSARLLACVEADGRWAASGAARTFPEWVARRGGASVGSARREVTLGKALAGDLPAAREAVAEGRMSLEHAQVLAQLAPTSDARRAALTSDKADRNEAHLVTAAAQVGVDDYRRIVRGWAAAVDTVAHETEHAATVAKEYLYVTRRPGGVDIQGFLAGENAETLTTALRAVTGVPAADDVRSPEQRRAAALTDLARLVLDRGLGGAGGALVRPHISVHVPYDTYTRLAAHPDDAPVILEGPDGTLSRPAELDDGTPIPTSVLARIACDAEITRIVFGPDSQPLDVGRTQRTYTGSQRRAVIARDRHCKYPGCTAPPTISEVHHTRWWGRDHGTTSVATGILLCAYHHHLIHRRAITITRTPAGWAFTERDGRPITPPRGAPPGAPAQPNPAVSPPRTGTTTEASADDCRPDPARTPIVDGQLALAG